jgi:hypothetical protein
MKMSQSRPSLAARKNTKQSQYDGRPNKTKTLRSYGARSAEQPGLVALQIRRAVFCKQKLHERCLVAALTPEDEKCADRAARSSSFGKKMQNKPNVATGRTKQRCCSF